ncbi:MAG: hypothetical protein Tsb0010_12980 [Parvularculaceae bacterium]
MTQLVEAGDYESATVQEITRRAGCSVGAFYGRFKDKNAALYALYDARCERLEGRILPVLKAGAAPDAPLAATLRAVIHATVENAAAGAAFIRAENFLTSHASAEPFWARAKLMNGRFYKALHKVLEAKTHEHAHPDPSTAALFVLAIIGGLPRDAVKIGPKLFEENLATREIFEAELNRIICGYLGVAASH